MAVINGTPSNDVINGTLGADVILAFTGNDVINSATGNDLVNGNQGFDTLNGGQGSDTLYGGQGNDVLRGGQGNDLLFGNNGNDVLGGDRGFDQLTGGSGDDLFLLGAGLDTDIITDYGSGDLISLTNLNAQDLNVFAGTGNNFGNTIIQNRSTGETLAIVNGVSPNAINFAPVVPNNSGNSARKFDIQFDYRYDTRGFFSDPNRRAALEAAANNWENIIKDDFPDVPASTETPFVVNPQTGRSDTLITDRPIDDLLIFVGARSIVNSTLAEGGPSGSFSNQTRYTGSNFEPWIGSITFNANTNWFFDPTPATANDIPRDKYDFISTATHEIGHVLGFGTSNAFDNLISGINFIGAKAEAVNNNQPISLESPSDLGHISSSYTLNGVEPLLNPSSGMGTRSFPTPLDIAILSDIGYII